MSPLFVTVAAIFAGAAALVVGLVIAVKHERAELERLDRALKTMLAVTPPRPFRGPPRPPPRPEVTEEARDGGDAA